MADSQFRVVFVTVPDAATAEKIAAGLVDAKLAACVSVVPGLVSHYFWEGKRQRSAEVLLVVKTRSGLFSELTQFVKERHPSKTPEIIGLPITDGESSYMLWL